MAQNPLVDPFVGYSGFGTPITGVPLPGQGEYGATTQSLPDPIRRQLPSFLSTLPMSIAQTPGDYVDPDTIAHASGASIWVDRPNLFDKGVLAHEATHLLQHTKDDPFDERRPGLYEYQQDAKGNWIGEGADANAADWLLAHRAKGGTVRDFGVEQQASMVEDYFRLHQRVIQAYQKNGYLTPEQSKYFEKIKGAYEPYIHELLGMRSGKWGDDPWSGDIQGEGLLGIPSGTDPRLAPPAVKAPGLPPGDIVGLTESTLMGGGPMRVRTPTWKDWHEMRKRGVSNP